MSKYDILTDRTSTLVAREADSQWIVAPGISIATTGLAVDAGGALAGRTLVVDGTIRSSAGNALVLGAGTLGSNAGMVAIKPDGDKIVRLEGQSAVIEAGHILLPESAHWLGDFLDEILAFPHGRFDDQVDSFSQFLTWAAKPRTRIHIG